MRDGHATPDRMADLQFWLQRRDSRIAIFAGNRLSDLRYLIWKATR